MAHNSAEYQRIYLREYRAKKKGFNSYSEYFAHRTTNNKLTFKERQINFLQTRVAYLESENARLQKCLEVALCKKQ
jgi:cell shape-determining protein MreC